jgi:hypothetical protein
MRQKSTDVSEEHVVSIFRVERAWKHVANKVTRRCIREGRTLRSKQSVSSWYLLTWLTLRHWRRERYFPAKRRVIFELHWVSTHKIVISVRTSDPVLVANVSRMLEWWVDMLILWRVKCRSPLQVNDKFSGYCNREDDGWQEHQLPYMGKALDPISICYDPVRIEYYATLQYTVNISACWGLCYVISCVTRLWNLDQIAIIKF